MEAHTVIVPTQMAYMHIPTNELRAFADGMFPNLAHSPVADVVKGFNHRYMAGHDLLLDVPGTFAKEGMVGGLKHAGHILLTDFVTKAGIPIPGFSHSGLGHFLEQANIHTGWLQVNLCETGVGIIAISEGSSDLIQTIHGTLLMSGATFFDTFGEGAIEIGMAVITKNPILMLGGIENVAAGIASVWHTVSVYVDPLVLFGSAGTSALIGFAFSYGLAGKSLSSSAINSIRSGTIGALFSLSPAFGFGALAGFVSYGMGRKLATIHNESLQGLLTIDNNGYRLLLEELCNGNVDLTEFLNRAEPHITFLENVTTLPTENTRLNTSVLLLSDQCLHLDAEPKILSENTALLKSDVRSLSDDSPILTDWYSRSGN
jgi:hypothetical protein